MIRRDPMRVPELAMRLGISVETFYRNRKLYEAQDGMPKPLSARGRHAYERAGMEAWLTRHHPLRPQVPANDVSIVPDPTSEDEHRARLRAAYAPRRRRPELDTVPAPARG